MVNALHKNATIAEGIHIIHNWEFIDNSARDAYVYTSTDVGKVCKVGTTWFVVSSITPTFIEIGGSSGGNGTVIGPSSTTDNAIARWDGTDGYYIQNSSVTIDDSGNIVTAGTLNSINIASHGSRHNPDNSDPVTVAAPIALTVGGSNNIGTANSLSRSDHVHSLPAFGSSAGTFAEGNDSRLTNDRTASGLRTASTIVSISGATAPTVGQVLIATSGTNGIWAPFTSMVHWGNNSVTNTTTIRFLSPGWIAGTAPTAAIQWRVPFAAVLRNLYIRHGTGAGNGNNIVYTVRVNTVASSLSVAIPSTSVNGEDTANSVTVAAGDLIDIRVSKAVDVATSPSNIMATLQVGAA